MYAFNAYTNVVYIANMAFMHAHKLTLMYAKHTQTDAYVCKAYTNFVYICV